MDGVYQIGSLEDYKAFAELVNNGESSSNAVLTADIDLGEDATMIGVADKPYTGVFDGQGHKVFIDAKVNITDFTAAMNAANEGRAEEAADLMKLLTAVCSSTWQVPCVTCM